MTNTFIRTLAVSGTNLFAGTGSGVFVSKDNGKSWSAINTGLTNLDVQSIAVSDTNIFAGTSGGVFFSNNNGASWKAINNGLTNLDVRSLVVTDTNLFAGTWGGSVYRRSLSEIITNIKDTKNNLPVSFYLRQNYPNPFNPTTVINYGVSKPVHVKLVVYNTIGQKVKTLVDGNKQAGDYYVTFNGSNLSSGVYFYHIQAGKYSATKKFVLMK